MTDKQKGFISTLLGALIYLDSNELVPDEINCLINSYLEDEEINEFLIRALEK